MKDIKETIKEFVANGVSITEIANNTGITRQALYKIMNGSVNPKVETIREIVDYLNLTYDAKIDYKTFF